jgi:peptidoglycan/LPS O-acetylase OafA/YrhL
LAAVAVVLFHFTTRYDTLFGRSEPLAVSLPWGQYGVDLFFMLSGFVILMTLERTSSAVQFAWGRLTRLFPAYWVAVGLTFGVVAACGLPGQEVTWREALVNLTMVQSLLGAPHVDGAYWSLQAELIFYVNMLILFRLGAFRMPAATVLIWAGMAWLVLGLQAGAVGEWPLLASILSKVATLGSLKFIGLFAIGILLYDDRRAVDGRLPRAAALVGCLATIGAASGTEALAVDLVLAALLAMAVKERLPWLGCRFLTGLGAISYCLYLTHQNVGYVLLGQLHRAGCSGSSALAFTLAVVLLLAVALHRTVEGPALRHLRRISLRSVWPAAGKLIRTPLARV